MRFRTWFEKKVIVPVPHANQQYDYDCGPAALRAAAEYFGVHLSHADFIKMADAGKVKGSHPEDLAQAAKSLGLQAAVKENMTVKDLLHHITNKQLVICSLQAWGNPKDYDERQDGHFVVAMGFDTKKKTILFRDPSMHDGSIGFIPYDELMRRWKDFEAYQKKETNRLGVVIWSDKDQEEKPALKEKIKKIP